jgi:mono/diheme cytochrome c family protein
VAGCSASSGAPNANIQLPDGGADAKDVGGSLDARPTMSCRPSPLASEDLSGRIDLASASAGQRFVKTSDLFTRFNSICGGCHVAAANGGFQASAQTFATVFDASRLARIESNDPSFAMPPEGKAFSSRGPDDPVRILTTYLEPWLAQGRPVDMFVMPPAAGSDTSSGSYAYTAMTNLGDCIPSPALYQSSASDEMTAKDQFFATATALPSDLADTDLTSFDTAALAATGMIAYRPTYPLWSDGSGKLRFIRVPKGASIVFHKDTQTFDIPPYTRFYKTFFRTVVDKSGRTRNRKMETRLIVSLPDGIDTDGVTPLPKALYGTYLWSDDETSATLWNNPYRDGTGFTDLTETYITNEVAYQDVIDGLPTGAGTLAQKIDTALNDVRNAGVRQHYAVPGSLRCVQCHRGSPTKDFVLGFYPLQVAQRQAGTGGIYDPVDADELNQLQRLIDYGLITGMTSPTDVVPLELSQLPRTPRTAEELTAQAYMVGNCAHCHNPRGYPSLSKPSLAPVLNFLPFSTASSGIFQFSLETMSPVRSRGANQDVPIPYITPSLRDYPVADDGLVRVDNGADLSPPDPTSSIKRELTWSPKYATDLEGSPWRPRGCSAASGPYDDEFCRGRRTGHSFVPAPWRALIYRNVDTTFPYFDDYVPFPHMPMNTAGFDCRAPRIMGDWMVSIPAILKSQYQGMSEDTIPHDRKADGTYPRDYVDGPQPYQEVQPGDYYYPSGLAGAKARLAEYRGGIRYNYCQDILGNDILDPVQDAFQSTSLEHATGQYYPIAKLYLNGGIPPKDPSAPGYYVQPAMGVPYHAEWFDYDPTEKAPWAPRRSIWPQVLISGIPDSSFPAGTDHLDDATIDSRRRLTAVLQTVDLTDDLRAYATTSIPYGLWQKKPECAAKFAKALADPSSNVKKVSNFTGANRPTWMDRVSPAPLPNDPVYMMQPGEALYRHICINCHGPKADGHGLQSDALAASSEGQARPANFAGGLFGPLDNLGANMVYAFDLEHHTDKKTAEKWASRYMPWMTLGGTLQLIPDDVINQVQATTILGERRQNLIHLPPTETASANMLNLAKGLCAVVLPDLTDSTISYYFEPGQWDSSAPPPSQVAPINADGTPFIRSNGDWEMWMKLCSEKNRQVLRVYRISDPNLNGELLAELSAIYYADDGKTPIAYQYPTNGQVWDQNRVVRTSGVTADNYFPTCLDATAIGSIPAAALQAMITRVGMPVCDSTFLTHKELLLWDRHQSTPVQVDTMREWSLRGAINAGMSVFSYLEANSLSLKPLPPYYNECQLLP